MSKRDKKIIIIVGPTAVGKTQVAYWLAKRIKGEIICADAMQVYQGLPILTDSPPQVLLKSVTHHLFSRLALTKEYNVARYIADAGKIIDGLQAKKKVAIVVGGSGFYVSSLLDGIFSGPGEDRKLRKKLNAQAIRYGNSYLYKRLERLDPKSASAIHPNNTRRIIRALEVYIKTGQKMSELKKQRQGLCSDYRVRIFALRRSRQELYEIIDSRVEGMFKRGAINEVKKTLPLKLSKTAKQIIGLKEIVGFLKGEHSRQEAQRLIKRNSRHLAKRQLAWFKRDKRIRWLDIKGQDNPQDIARRIIRLI